MNPPKQETIDRVLETVQGIMIGVGVFAVRMFVFATFAGLCALPFILIPDKGKVTFWYCTGAYGLYLAGAKQFLNRWL